MVRSRLIPAQRFGRPAPSCPATATTTSTRLFATVSEPSRPERAALPSGTVTFLFTDIEGSTRLLTRLGGGYAELLGEHRRVLRAAFHAYDGREVHTTLDVHRAARICSAGHGGQILISSSTRELVIGELPGDVALTDLGEHRLKDIDSPEHLFGVLTGELPQDSPAPRSLSPHSHGANKQPPPPNAPSLETTWRAIATRPTAASTRALTPGRPERRDRRNPTAASTTRRALASPTTNTRPLNRTLPTRTPRARLEDKASPRPASAA
jgi:hypothetical protein